MVWNINYDHNPKHKSVGATTKDGKDNNMMI